MNTIKGGRTEWSEIRRSVNSILNELNVKSGTAWRAGQSSANAAWTSIAYGEGLFVAVAKSNDANVMTSPDGVNWTSRNVLENNTWQSIVYGNGLFVAVSDTGIKQVMISSDGINWTAQTTPDASAWKSVAYGNGVFVAAAANGPSRVMTSRDGLTWTLQPTPNTDEFNSIIYANGLFVAVGPSDTHGILTSPDGVNWTARQAPENNNWRGITYGEGTFVAVADSGYNRVMLSHNGTEWFSGTISKDGEWADVTYFGGKFFATSKGPQNPIVFSSDGIDWEQVFYLEDAPGYSAMCTGDGLLVALSDVAHENQILSFGKKSSSENNSSHIIQGGVDIRGGANSAKLENHPTGINEFAIASIGYINQLSLASFENDKGYLTAETDTLDSVIGRGGSTSKNISIGALTSTHGTFKEGLGVEGDFTIKGNILIDNNGTISPLWDNLPVSTPAALGGVKVDPTASNVYLDTNNVLQVSLPDDLGQWDNVEGGIQYSQGNVKISNGYYYEQGKRLSTQEYAQGLITAETLDSLTSRGNATQNDITVGNLTASKDVVISGNLTVNGTSFVTKSETVEIGDNLAILNSGETGAGITAGFAGWEADRGTLPNYIWGYDELRDLWVLGENGDELQAVATREDLPMDGGFAQWDQINNRFNSVSKNAVNHWQKVDNNLTYTSGNVIVSGTISAQGYNASNWDAAHAWGDHSKQGYLTSLGFSGLQGSPSDVITPGDGLSWSGNTLHSTVTQYTDENAVAAIKADAAWNRLNWDAAYNWGNHAEAGYLTAMPLHEHSTNNITSGVFDVARLVPSAHGVSPKYAIAQYNRFSSGNGISLDDIVTSGIYGLGSTGDHTKYPTGMSGNDAMLVMTSGSDVNMQVVVPRSSSNAATMAFRGGTAGYNDWKYVWHDKNLDIQGVWSVDEQNIYYTLGNIGVNIDKPVLGKVQIEGDNNLALSRGLYHSLIKQGEAGEMIVDTATGNNIVDVAKGSDVKIRLNTSGSSYFIGGNLVIGAQTSAHKLGVEGTIYGTTIYSTGGDSSNWNEAYNWGNHGAQGYLKSETDPTVPNHVKAITATKLSNWTTAYNHSKVNTGNPHNISLGDIGESLSSINYWTKSGEDLSYTGNVDINNTSASSRLTINNSTAWSYIRYSYQGATTWDAAVYQDGNYDIRENGTISRFTVTKGGNVEINGALSTYGFKTKWRSERQDPTNNKYYKIGYINLASNYNSFYGVFQSVFNAIGMNSYSIQYTLKARNSGGSIECFLTQINQTGYDNNYDIDVIALVNGTTIELYVGGLNLSYQYPSHSILHYDNTPGEREFIKIVDDTGTTTLPSGTQVGLNKTINTDRLGNVLFYNNVGIGTTSPNLAQLQIQNTTETATLALRSYYGDNNNQKTGDIYFTTDANRGARVYGYREGGSTQHSIGFETMNGDDTKYTPLWLSYNGNVGIGTTDPNADLELLNNNGAFIRMSSAAASAYEDMGGIEWYQTTGSPNVVAKIDVERGGSAYDQGNIRFYARKGTDNGERMRITSNGVAINKTSANYTLDVNGTGRFTSNLISEGNITASGKLTASIGGTTATNMLSLTSAGVTTLMGSANSDWFHMNTDAASGFYMYDNLNLASLTSRGDITASGEVAANTYFKSSDAAVVLGTSSSGNVYLRPVAYNSTQYQTVINQTGDMTVGGTITASGGITTGDNLFVGSNKFQEANGKLLINYNEGGPLVYCGGSTSDVFTVGVTGEVSARGLSVSADLVAGRDIAASKITSRGSIIADTYFRSSDASVVLGTSGSGGAIYLRPNGYGSTDHEVLINSSGEIVLQNGLGGTNNAEIFISPGKGSGGSSQISMTDNGDMTWAFGGDDNDNSFKIHGSASSTIPTIYNLTNPLFELTTGGDVIAAGIMRATNFALSSDRRLKRNITYVEDEIITFNYKHLDESRLRYGVVAQELQKTNPEMIYKDEKGFLQVGYIDYLLHRVAKLQKEINELKNEKRVN